MAEILGVGVTHSPLLVGTDQRMAGALERVMRSPRLPEHLREPSSWPSAMRHEWDEHQAGRAAPAHRQRAIECFRAARAALEAFNPDFIVIFGDDQYENFREDGVAPFGVFALDEVESRPFARAGAANAWSEPADTVVKTKGHPAGGRYLAKSLTEQGFDITWAYRMRYENGLPHAFLNALLLLDYDRKGLPWPVVPFHVNCYGSSTISKRGAFAHIDGTGSDEPDPLAEPSTLLRDRRGDGSRVGRVALACRARGILKLVARVPDRKAPLSVSGSRVGSGPLRRTSRRNAVAVEIAVDRATGRRGSAGTAQLGLPRRSNGRAWPQAGLGGSR